MKGCQLRYNGLYEVLSINSTLLLHSWWNFFGLNVLYLAKKIEHFIQIILMVIIGSLIKSGLLKIKNGIHYR